MNRFATVFAAAALLLWSGAALAQIEGIEIVDRGIYTYDVITSAVDAEGVKVAKVGNVHFAVDTANIPMQYDVRFGFRFKLNGPKGETVTLRKVTIYPPAGVVPNATGQRVYRHETTLTVKIGDIHYAGYRFTEPWELAPGQWVMQLWDGKRRLTDQRFNISPP